VSCGDAIAKLERNKAGEDKSKGNGENMDTEGTKKKTRARGVWGVV
jgi:hypothetical protein